MSRADDAQAQLDALAAFWREDVLLDRPDAAVTGTRPPFDPLGASLAVLHGFVNRDDYSKVLAGMQAVDTPCGVTIRCRHNPVDAREALVIDNTDGVVVWPFVVGFAVLALVHMHVQTGLPGYFVAARDQLRKLEALTGFYEWYDPRDGSGCGAKRQTWSAALYLRARRAFDAAVNPMG